jgi:nicotinate-nucleotide pyrophosphorylase (carboxylating)
MNSAQNSIWKNLLAHGLSDDQWQWDWTSLGVCSLARGSSNSARIVAKSDGIWACQGLLESAQELAQEHGVAFETRSAMKDGQAFKRGDVLSQWTGSPRGILAFERPVLNLASYACGVATQTQKLVAIVAAAAQAKKCSAPRVAATRKTLPLYRDLGIHGVRVGGGFSHRVSLSGGVLIKENHLAVAGGIQEAISGVRNQAPHGLKIEIEVQSLDEVISAAKSGADGLLLDNFLPAQVSEATQWIQKNHSQIWIEVSGGIRAENIADYVLPGVSVISSGSLTHSVVGPDLSLLVD